MFFGIEAMRPSFTRRQLEQVGRFAPDQVKGGIEQAACFTLLFGFTKPKTAQRSFVSSNYRGFRETVRSVPLT
jgi:hypothetical protein